MMRSKLLINNPQAMAICSEMKALNEACEAKKAQIHKKAQDEFSAHVEAVNKQIAEDFERIRMAMGITVPFVNPLIEDCNSDLGIIILHHGEQ